MCDRLSELRAAVHHYAAGFDAKVLSGDQARAVVDDANAVVRMAALVQAKAAARVAECREWKGAGERSAAAHLAKVTGGVFAPPARPWPRPGAWSTYR